MLLLWDVLSFRQAVIVVSSWVDIIIEMMESSGETGVSSSIRILRLLRVSRLLRIVKTLWIVRFVGALRTLVASLVDTFKPLFWAMLLLLIIIYIAGWASKNSFSTVGWQSCRKLDESNDCCHGRCFVHWRSSGTHRCAQERWPRYDQVGSTRGFSWGVLGCWCVTSNGARLSMAKRHKKTSRHWGFKDVEGCTVKKINVSYARQIVYRPRIIRWRLGDNFHQFVCLFGLFIPFSLISQKHRKHIDLLKVLWDARLVGTDPFQINFWRDRLGWSCRSSSSFRRTVGATLPVLRRVLQELRVLSPDLFLMFFLLQTVVLVVQESFPKENLAHKTCIPCCIFFLQW